jgi:integrase
MEKQMASIRQDSRYPDEKRYLVHYRDAAGRQRTKGGFRRKRDAQAWAEDLESSKRRGEALDPARGRMTFGTYAELWLADQHHLKPKTLHGYRQTVEKILVPRIGAVPLARLDHRRAQDLFNELAQHYGAWSLQGAHVVARRIMNAAVAEDAVAKNPFVGIKRPTPPKRPMVVVTAEQVEALAAALPPRHGMLVRFAAWTGLRSGELAALRVSDFSPDLATVTVSRTLADVGGELHEGTTKTDRVRVVGVPGVLRDALREHLATVHGTATPPPAARVFPGDKGGPLRMANVYRRHFKPAVRAALPESLHGLRFHDLRHTCASLLIGLGAHPKEIADRLGHSSISVTMDVYGHVFPDRHEAMTNAMDAAMRAAQEGR